MNYITLDFESILTGMAKERGLTISDVKGTLEFTGPNMTCVKLAFNINDTWLNETVECLNELTFEDDAAKVLDKYFLRLPKWIYTALAENRMKYIYADPEPWTGEIDGIELEYDYADGKFSTFIDDGDKIPNDFNPSKYESALESERQRDDDSRKTYKNLRRAS